MITITAKFKIVPGKESEAEEAIKLMADTVEAKEPGALTYLYNRNLKDPSEIVVFEVYEDDAAFAAHGGTEHMGAFRGHFGTLFDPSSVQIDRYERIAGFSR